MIYIISLQEQYQKFAKIQRQGQNYYLYLEKNFFEEQQRARGFWERGQQAFFHIRVFDPNACRYLNKSLQQCHAMNEHKKERLYNERVLKVDHGTFTPLEFSIYGSMRRECNTFYSLLSQLISSKRNLSKSITVNWIRTKVCFALLKCILLCLRGSRTVCRKVSESEGDIDVSHEHAKI